MERFEKEFNIHEEKESNNELNQEHRFTKEMEKPKEEWSEDFKCFLDGKIKENDLEKQQEKLIKILEGTAGKKEKDWTEQEKDAYKMRKDYIDFFQEKKEGIIDMYFNDLELTEDDFLSKKIIDIGCGSKAELIEYAIEKFNSGNVYGLDRNFKEEILKKYPHNLYKGNFEERLPINNLDLIIARASIVEEELIQEKFLENLLSSLNEEGELRVYPIFMNHFESGKKETLVIENKLLEMLDKFSKQYNFDYNFKTKEISVYDKDKYPTSKRLLTINKKADFFSKIEREN